MPSTSSPASVIALCCLALAALCPHTRAAAWEQKSGTGGGTEVLFVGPGRELTRPSQAARIARDGAVVEIAAGEYEGDVAVWRQNDLVLRGVCRRPHLRAGGRSAEGKAIWVIRGDLVAVENPGFSGRVCPPTAAPASARRERD